MMRDMNQPTSLIAGMVLMAAGCAAVTPPTTSTNTVTAAPAPAPKTNQLDAVFEAVTTVPVAAAPKVWTDLTVLEAAPHGSRVKRGDVLVKLDLDKLRDYIHDMEQDRPAAALALQLATVETENLQQTTPFKLDAARRAQRVATEDLTVFEKTGRAQKEKAAKYSVKSAQQRLDNDREELKQLQKMYKADDLVEETEEIILKRQKFAVEMAEHNLESATLSAQWSLQHVIPREAEFFKAQKRDQDAALSLAERTLPGNLTKKQYELEKLKRDRKKTEKRLADLKADLENLALRAPADGLVYYGACETGRWTTGVNVAKKLVPGGKLMPGEIIMTIVNPDKLRLKAIIAESNLGRFKPGQEGTTTLVSAPDRKFAVRLDEISAVPLLTGGFEARLSWRGALPLRVTPGMTCKVSFGK